jgi:hypothetical protein
MKKEQVIILNEFYVELRSGGARDGIECTSRQEESGAARVLPALVNDLHRDISWLARPVTSSAEASHHVFSPACRTVVPQTGAHRRKHAVSRELVLVVSIALCR